MMYYSPNDIPLGRLNLSLNQHNWFVYDDTVCHFMISGRKRKYVNFKTFVSTLQKSHAKQGNLVAHDITVIHPKLNAEYPTYTKHLRIEIDSGILFILPLNAEGVIDAPVAYFSCSLSDFFSVTTFYNFGDTSGVPPLYLFPLYNRSDAVNNLHKENILQQAQRYNIHLQHTGNISDQQFLQFGEKLINVLLPHLNTRFFYLDLAPHVLNYTENLPKSVGMHFTMFTEGVLVINTIMINSTQSFENQLNAYVHEYGHLVCSYLQQNYTREQVYNIVKGYVRDDKLRHSIQTMFSDTQALEILDMLYSGDYANHLKELAQLDSSYSYFFSFEELYACAVEQLIAGDLWRSGSVNDSYFDDSDYYYLFLASEEGLENLYQRSLLMTYVE